MAERDRVVGPNEAIGVIYYTANGRSRRWTVGCHLIEDNEQTLRAHLL